MKRIVGTYTPEGLGSSFNYARDTGAAPWHKANAALLVPLVVSRATNLRQACVITGIDPPVGNFDVGVYRENGTLLGSTGPVPVVGVPQTCQVVNFPALVSLTANTPYYLAMAVDNNTAQFEVAGTLGSKAKAKALGVKQADDAFPLPANIAPFLAPGTQNVPIVGLNAGLNSI